MNHREHLFTIQQISRKLNIPKPTLRFWEKELDGIIVPLRTPGGQRRYTLEHLSIIQKINRMRKQGMSIIEINRKLNKKDVKDMSNSGANQIDTLANQIAVVVRAEIQRFFDEH